MSYNNNYINNDNEKIITIKKNLYCTNCNKKGHIYKSCLEPVISNGIIGIYIENLKKENIDDLENFLSINLNSFKYKKLNNKSKISSNNIKFLMIQRKNSLGYLEFMRGRYDVNNNQNIVDVIHKDYQLGLMLKKHN